MVKVIEEVSQLIGPKHQTIICGDVNCDPVSSPFAKFLFECGFSQIVTQPTHIHGNTLDHFYIRGLEAEHFIHPLYFSDHDAICALVKVVA